LKLTQKDGAKLDSRTSYRLKSMFIYWRHLLETENIGLREHDNQGEIQASPKILPDKRISEYLASERTFLAWIRTSIAVISLGFVIARFSIWLDQLAATSGRTLPGRTGLSMIIGSLMMGFGAILALLAAMRMRAVDQAIERGEIRPGYGTIRLMTGLVILLALVLIAYMILTSSRL
jgi:putative membrane protein